MSRPAKPAKVADDRAKHRERAEKESVLKGSAAVKVPDGLTPSQAAIAEGIIEALKEADILSGLDETVLKMAAFSMDGISTCVTQQNEDPYCMDDSNFRQKMKRYEETFRIACSELGLSPQARAKLAIAAGNKDTTLEAIKAVIGK
jgi:P27 family predicted phage terminase small subunit